jgi:hypothetical protein
MAFTLHHYELPFFPFFHQNTTFSLQSYQKLTIESQRLSITPYSINQNNNKTLRTCKYCKTQFDPSLNHLRAYRFHTAHFGGIVLFNFSYSMMRFFHCEVFWFWLDYCFKIKFWLSIHYKGFQHQRVIFACHFLNKIKIEAHPFFLFIFPNQRTTLNLFPVHKAIKKKLIILNHRPTSYIHHSLQATSIIAYKYI